LKAALEDRIAAQGQAGSWPAIITNLDSLTETEIEHEGKRFIIRSAPRPAAGLASRAAAVVLPPTFPPQPPTFVKPEIQCRAAASAQIVAARQLLRACPGTY
jgi:hypothetical protein